ncbi:MAG TPA: PSPA7_2676 family Cys-rich small protein [Pseudomonas sp.]|nr:PSPA7_2676 family Cys-rich small protein [Pseudomonas sp.]
MKFICLIAGCLWEDAMPLHLGKEDVLCQCCSRCGSQRITRAAAAGWGTGTTP